MKTSALIYSLGCALLFSPLVLGQASDPARLVSVKKCAMCHKKDDKGNQAYEKIKHERPAK